MAHQKRWAGDLVSSQSKLITSVKEARKLLGHDAVDLSDASIMGIINSLTKIANGLLEKTRVPNNEMV